MPRGRGVLCKDPSKDCFEAVTHQVFYVEGSLINLCTEHARALLKARPEAVQRVRTFYNRRDVTAELMISIHGYQKWAEMAVALARSAVASIEQQKCRKALPPEALPAYRILRSGGSEAGAIRAVLDTILEDSSSS